MVYLLFLVGFALLIFCADWLVLGASALARRFNVSELVIGLTIVAFGTSAPELAVNIYASVKGNNAIAIGNVVGSNIANIMLILGICAALRQLKVNQSSVWREIPFAFFAAVILAFMVNDQWLMDGAKNVIGRVDGLILLACFALFLLYTVRLAKNQKTDDEPHENMALGKAVGLVAAGLVGLVLGGKWIVDGAVAIAQTLGFSESFIGLTVVAVGTSLPELASSVAAVRRGSTDMAIGNVIGSNIFNTFWILGCTSIISPIDFLATDNLSILVNVAITAVLFGLLFMGKRHHVDRWQGALLVFGYIAYLAVLVHLG